MRHYTVLSGTSAKLLVTNGGVSSTVTTTNNEKVATELSESLSNVASTLPLYAGDAKRLANFLKALGLRENQVYQNIGESQWGPVWNLTLDHIADRTSGYTEEGHSFTLPASLGNVLFQSDLLPDNARKAVRSELRALLCEFSGVAVPASAGTIEGEVSFSAVEFLRDSDRVVDYFSNRFGDPEEDPDATLLGYYNDSKGHPLEGTLDELDEMGWELSVDVDPYAMCKWLSANRTALLTEIAEVVSEPDGLEEFFQ